MLCYRHIVSPWTELNQQRYYYAAKTEECLLKENFHLDKSWSSSGGEERKTNVHGNVLSLTHSLSYPSFPPIAKSSLFYTHNLHNAGYFFHGPFKCNRSWLLVVFISKPLRCFSRNGIKTGIRRGKRRKKEFHGNLYEIFYYFKFITPRLRCHKSAPWKRRN